MREPAVAHSGLLSLVHLSSENSYRPGRSSQRRRRSRVLLAPSSTLSLRLRAVRRDAQPAVSGLAALSLPAAPKETGQRHRWPGEDGLSVVPVPRGADAHPRRGGADGCDSACRHGPRRSRLASDQPGGEASWADSFHAGYREATIRLSMRVHQLSSVGMAHDPPRSWNRRRDCREPAAVRSGPSGAGRRACARRTRRGSRSARGARRFSI
jgi:hypothetical protein